MITKRGRKIVGAAYWPNKLLNALTALRVLSGLKAHTPLKAVVAIIAISLVMIYSGSAHALGVGTAAAQSYIGQPLSIRIPLFSVQNPATLLVKLVNDSNGASSKFNAKIDRSNSQLGVLIVSSDRINDPKLSFTLNLLDSGNAFTKKFTVLLNSPSNSGSKSVVSQTPVQTSAGQLSTQNPNVMGPHDWATAGQIAHSFGAVLDGQSLWRVARRLNTAMGVSLNQMMWALYSENPAAFADRSVSSLKAGTYLRIPSQAQVNLLSDAHAKAQIDNLNRYTNQTVIDLAERLDKPSKDIQGLSDFPNAGAAFSEQQDTSQIFEVTGLEQAVAMHKGMVAASGDQSQVIIGSLAQTVGNLTRELIRKDKRISFLEEKVAALEAYAGIENMAAAQPALAASANLTADSVAFNSPALNSSIGEVSQIKSSLVWGSILILGIIAAVSYLFRQRIVELVQSLNFFGRSDSLYFESAFYDQGQDDSGTQHQEPSKDYSIMSVVERTLDDSETLEESLYLAFDDSVTYTETAEEPMDEIILEDNEDLTFSERFDRLIKEKDYDFARELLDFARYNEIDDQRYHCERLRLLKAMRDEDGFYEYYYEIESKIPKFDHSLQTKISQFVVQLAQH